MTKEKKTSVIKEAVAEYKELMEAASANAKKKLADEFPNEFNKLLKEEIDNKNKPKKESYKKIDEGKESDKDDVGTNKESVMKNEKETKKVVKEEEGKTKKVSKPFEEKAPENGPDVVKEERDKDFMGDIETDTPNKADGKTEDGDTFVEEPTTKKESLANDTQIKEEFDITELDANSVGIALENAEEEDEVITMDEIESEIANIEGLDEDLSAGADADKPKAGKDDGIAYDKLVNMKNQIDEMLSAIGEQKNNGGQGANKVNMGGPTTAMIDEEEDEVYEQKNQGGKQSIPGREKGGPTQQMVDEEDEEITRDDVEAVLGGEVNEEEVDENLEHTQTHHNARKTGSHNHTNYGKENRLRDAMKNEGEDKKIGSLIKENKELTKKLNETKKYKQSVTTLVEQYKDALGKYRNQLKEMAIFNSNLAHVNNLLVNESLSLTQKDKISIINEFKKVNTIAESQERYKSILTEMKKDKRTLTENLEDKVSASVAPSSKKLDEAKEVTAYENNEHINKMKKLIETIEGRGSKKIIK
jgi:hypothetical protein